MYIPVPEATNAGPCTLVRSTKGLEYVEELLELGVARKERLLADHLCKNAPDAPHVDGRGVVSAAEKNLGRPIPKGNDLHRGNGNR